MKRILFVLLLLFCISCEPVNEVAMGQEVLKIEISLNKEIFEKGEIPKLSVVIQNVSDADLYLYNHFDSYHYPKIYLEIFDKASDAPYNIIKSVIALPRNELIKENFQKLVPKQTIKLYDDSIELTQDCTQVLKNSGEYKLKLILDYKKDSITDWCLDGNTNSELLEMFDLIPKKKFFSNDYEFSVK